MSKVHNLRNGSSELAVVHMHGQPHTVAQPRSLWTLDSLAAVHFCILGQPIIKVLKEGCHMSDDKSNKNWFAKHKVLTVIISLVVLGIVIGAASGGSNSAMTNTTADTATPKAQEKKPSVPAEYTSALTQADSYANMMHMSKQGVYDQLTSQYGGKFSAKAAQYAIDNVKSDWNANALAKAKDYQKQQSLSPSAIHDQLTSAAGEKFTTVEADYAITHLND